MQPIKKHSATDETSSSDSSGFTSLAPKERILKDTRIADNLLIRLANQVLRLVQRATQHIAGSAIDEQKAASKKKAQAPKL